MYVRGGGGRVKIIVMVIKKLGGNESTCTPV